MELPDAISFLIPVAEAKVVLVFLELYPAPTLFMATGLILEFNLLIAFKYSIARILLGLLRRLSNSSNCKILFSKQ